MRKLPLVLMGVVIVIMIILGVMWQTIQSQKRASEKLLEERRAQETNAKLLELQRQMQQLATSRPAGDAAVSAIPSGGLPGSELEKVRQTKAAMEEGWKLVATRDPRQAKQAATIFQEAIARIDSKNPQFYNGLGRAELVAGAPREAIAAWRKGLELAPKEADMHSGIGWAYWNLKDYARAKAAWEAALQLAPKSPDAWSAMVWIYLGLGQWEKSRDGFEILLARDMKNNAYIQGLNMAKSRNTDREQIAVFFRLPPLETFSQPLDPDPALPPATAPGQ